MIIKTSTIQLLRLPFSFFLLPVYLFALGQTVQTDWWMALLVFLILHLLVYPASNGYNSYMDRDQTPVGGLRHPLQPTRQLWSLVLGMDILAVLLGWLVSGWFALGVLMYILASRAYSSRQIRLKKYPLTGFLVVVVCQGALVFWLTYHGVDPRQPLEVPVTGCLASSLLIAGAYPLTQVYQHQADAADGVRTISMMAGTRGTFILSALLFNMAFLVLGLHFGLQLELDRFGVLLFCFMPVLVYFVLWTAKVWKDPAEASFDNLMRMNLLSSACSVIGFGILVIWKLFD
ncbi:UbiA family prenyltransferase [Flavihumibacter stibioxidans]|uniref:Prenyltransferase n=1 Tax=Flavihumibacter stibioxidans TaxID=1834163 RepID=A0ABR7M820_9BACT|nr:UbiA family prenyltransferase [Flavihumibacter stibioxidans]MBC6490778.1 hypothetical protein [Flavihumibacter stibioxidans]